MSDRKVTVSAFEPLDNTLPVPDAASQEVSASVSADATGRRLISAWAVSVAIHVGLFVGMLILVFPYSLPVDAEGPVARAELVGDPEALPSPTEVRWRSPEFPAESSMPAGRLDFGPSPGKSAALGELAGPSLPSSSDLSIAGIGTGGGDFGMYGLETGGGADFFGLGKSARGVQRIVYVVDRSGSMVETFAIVRQELRRSIGELRRSQKFHVIFFNAGEPLENPPKKLVSAVTAHKQQFFEFVQSVIPGGATDPAPAMRRALSMEPHVIYFLTDGEFSPSLLPQLNEWNKDRRTRIFTIAFFGAEGAALLERIAREHEGEYRFVSEQDLP